MKNAALCLIAIGVPLYCQDAASREADLAHVRNTFQLTVKAPYKDAALLFGPNGERGWAEGNWDPHFLYPLPGRDVEGAVFTVQHGSHRAVWVNTAMDLDGRHFQYVYFIPDVMVTTIDVRFEFQDADTTKVRVVYERTALTSQANEHVRELGESDRTSGPDWQKAIERYLAKGGGQR